MTESPLAEYDTQIADLHAQMKPLQDRLRAVAEERRAYADLLAEDTDDPQALAALREASQVAYQKFEKHVRATTHEAIWNFCDYLPIEDDYSTGYLIGPHLSIQSCVDAEYLTGLRDSLLDFAARPYVSASELVEWQIATVAGVDLTGMIFADILSSDLGTSHNFCLWFTPDGERAVLLDTYHYGGVDAEGDLLQVLAVAARIAHNGR